ncbi:uncharacterized protein BJ212DRAFT_1356544 [Suillus subaureus]|uniref:Uncharacterized protein n=1 Tax=Suillus subaureus TaxID=48587 RepID=A0A9P7EBC5_9AGAM|nr:uncharacterized protein BJ212DRAFT_1356544 [Suillus subaureus]KAG1816126.1 hypothetical protein BJ212DRAFT_1356544 [Suillus subaureus]
MSRWETKASEFTRSYSYGGFRSCIAASPYDTIHQALTVSDGEALSRWEPNPS